MPYGKKKTYTKHTGPKQTLDRDSLITFGKYKDKTVQDVLEENPGYLRWFSENVDKYSLAEDIIEELKATGK